MGPGPVGYRGRDVGGKEAVFPKGRELYEEIKAVGGHVCDSIKHEHRFVMYGCFRTEGRKCRKPCRTITKGKRRAKKPLLAVS